MVRPRPVPGPRVAGIALDGLVAHLIRLARDAAHDVITGYTTDEGRERVKRLVDAGAVVEHLVKAVLAKLNPVLLADRKNDLSMLTFSGVTLSPPQTAAELKTIAYADAMRVLILAEPTLKSIQKDAAAIISARNAAAHMGMVDRSTLDTYAQDVVRIVAILLPFLGEQPERFWSKPLMPVVEALEREKDDRSQARVASKIAKARAVFAQLTRGLEPSASEAILRGLESRQSLGWGLNFTSENLRHECPACGRSGWVSYERALRWEDGQFEYDSYLGAPSDCVVPVDLEPIMFDCPVCGLLLDAAEDELEDMEGIGILYDHEMESVGMTDPRLYGPED